MTEEEKKQFLKSADIFSRHEGLDIGRAMKNKEVIKKVREARGKAAEKKKRLLGSAASSSKIEGIDFERAKKNKAVLKKLQEVGRGYTLAEDAEPSTK